MNREELLLEIKKLLEQEMKSYVQPVSDQIPGELKEKAKDLHKSVSKFVEDHPIESIGMAALAGFLVARFFYKGND